MSIKVDKSVWNNIKKSLKNIDDYSIDTGWFSGQNYGPDNDNLPMAFVAALNELGHVNRSDAAIPGAITPPRPFMRIGFTGFLKTSSSQKAFQSVIESVLKGQSAFSAMERITPFLGQGLKQIMNSWTAPPNASLTISLKGFDDPLRDSGQLIANANSRVRRKGAS